MARIAWLLLSLLATSYVSNAYRIMMVSPMPGKSHGILGDGVVKLLLKAGHEVTYITAFPGKNSHPNCTQIDVSSNVELIPSDMINISSILKESLVMDFTVMAFIMLNASTTTILHENVQKILTDPKQHFDLILAEYMFDELYASLAGLYQAPLIWFSTVEPHFMILRLVDEHLPPAYNGWVITDVPPFSLWQRIQEVWFQFKFTAAKETIIAYLQNSFYSKNIVPLMEKRGIVPPSFSDLKYNASLVLGNSHVSLGLPTKVPPMYKNVGGYHIEDDSKPLPEDLQKLLDEAKDGVIYFSMGTNLKGTDLPPQLKDDFVKLFGSLKQKVLWKFEEELPNLPKNVKVLKWAPQKSILAHPNCILFITHGGLLSTTETIHTGTPIIGVPVFADQFMNVDRAVSKGFALKVPLSYTMASGLKVAIDEMLSNPKYTQKVKELSLIYHDRPVKPGVELVHWVEHVIKTGGAPHLRSPALHIPWYQKILLDIAILFAIALYALVKVFKLLKSYVFRKKVKDTKKRN